MTNVRIGSRRFEGLGCRYDHGRMLEAAGRSCAGLGGTGGRDCVDCIGMRHERMNGNTFDRLRDPATYNRSRRSTDVERLRTDDLVGGVGLTLR